jgi:hypothetical protein
MEDFISLFSKMSYHIKCFKTVNETTPKMFHNTKFYVVTLIVYEMHEMKFIYPNANVMGFHFLKTVSSR